MELTDLWFWTGFILGAGCWWLGYWPWF
jgi:hypothetical protein